MNTTREAALEAALNNIRELNMTGEDENGLKWANSDLIEQEIVFALSTPATEPQGYIAGLERAIKAARHSLVEFCGYPEASIMVEGLDRALAARPAPQPAADTRVVVKPLVWVPEDAPCTRFKAEALGGHMMIVELDPKTDPGKYSVGVDLGGICFKFVLAEYDDFLPKYTAPAKFEGIEAAKAAAKADYEARILSAIIGTATPAPSDKIAEAARVLLDATPNPVFDMLKPVLMGEFSQSMGGTDEDGNEVTHKIAISWTVTKEIIAAALRALAGQGETP